MKNFVKKTVAATLSVFGILSAMPSAFCAPKGENNPPANNGRGHIDVHSAMIVGKYFTSIEDFKNLEMVNEKYKNLAERYHFNPVGINFPEQLVLFPQMETYVVEKCGEDVVSLFTNDKIKKVVYLPCSFKSYQFREILEYNGIIDSNQRLTGNWVRDVEVIGGNPVNGCSVKFTSGEKTIVFLFDVCGRGHLRNIRRYNDYLERCGVTEGFIPSSTRIPLTSSITSLGKRAFSGDRHLTNVNIPNSVTSIGEGAYSYCRNLRNVTIPNSVKNIEKKAFCCSNLTGITIPDSVTCIKDYLFSGCLSLTNVNMPASITSIGDYAFGGCRSLNHIEIPDTVKSIGEGAFQGCVSLTDITIPNSVKNIGENVFNSCPNLNVIRFNGNVYSSANEFMKAFNDYRKFEVLSRNSACNIL